jgi:hypothetical protein
MDTTTILALTKARIGISNKIRDAYILAIIDAIIKELEDEKGIALDNINSNHTMFIVDYATWRYQNRDGDSGMPKNLRWRLKNMYVHSGNKGEE